MEKIIMKLAFLVALLVFTFGEKNMNGVECRTVSTNDEPLSCATPCQSPNCSCVRGICLCNESEMSGENNIKAVESRPVSTNNKPLSCATPCQSPNCSCVGGICLCNEPHAVAAHLNPTPLEADGQRKLN
ncbi:unnamed protein product [Linum trigynum]|uniref:Uncharacterized protein n=1 Tax=Linum trigynum TaxID=586398 RepID=A0AAV2EMI5_9ROSI